MQYFKKQAKRTRRQLNKKINNKARAIIKVQAPKAHIHAQLYQPKGMGHVCWDAIALSIVRNISFGMQSHLSP